MRTTGGRLRATAARLAPHLPVAVLIAAYVIRFSLLTVAVYDGYGSPGFDMGIFDQGIWLLSRFHAPFVTIMGRDLFGDHTSFIVLLAVPLYWIWPHAQLLLVLQTCLLAAAAVPIYLLARRLAGTVAATALAAAYLLNPALQWGNLEQFHPESFLVLTAALAVYAAVESRPRLLAAAVVLSLLVKEDTALLLIPLGVWVYLRRDRTWGRWIVFGSIAYMAFAYYAVIYPLLGTVSFYADRIPFGGVGGLVTTVVVHPVQFWRYVRSQGRLFYLWQMGVSVGFGFVWAPEIAAIGLLTLGENVLSDFGYMHEINYHYSLVLVPVLALGTAFAVGRLRTVVLRRAAALAVLGVAIVSCVLWGLAPFSRQYYEHPDPNSAAVKAVNAALRSVPPDAVVSADDFFVAHLDHRVQAYQWPTPFSAHYWGLYTEEGERLPTASQVQYVVVPSVLGGIDAEVFRTIADQFRPVASGGGVTVYKRVRLRG